MQPADPYLTSDSASFASVSCVKRWPIILTGAIDDVTRTTYGIQDGAKAAEGKEIISQLAALKYEMQHDRQLTELIDDGGRDIAQYNQHIVQLGNPQWHNVPWLFSECYLYRRIQTIFALSKSWKGYDVFSRQKLSTMRSSRPAIIELASSYKDDIQKLRAEQSLHSAIPEEAEKLMFIEMAEICLWGNATDLSLLTSLTYEDIQKLQGSKARKAAEENILVNDLGDAYATLKNLQSTNPNSSRQIDIILDNSGFELFVDLTLAGYLLESGLATQIVLHPKSMPWFVSDVLPSDFQTLLSVLASPRAFFEQKEDDSETEPRSLTGTEVEDLSFLFEQLSQYHSEGQLVLRPNDFWSTGHSYWDMPTSAPTLFQDLRDSDLVIFKGDLNYRKLTVDAMWDTTTPFATAIGPLGPGSGMRTLSLRTCKADTVVGLPQGVDEILRAREGGGGKRAREWAWGGKYAVIEYCDGKST